MTEVRNELADIARTRLGKVLRNKWTLESLLGVGGMATVYAATHRNGSRAAVKVLHPELSTHSSLRERFLREGYAANKVGHAGAVRVLDDDSTEQGEVYLVMELLEGVGVQSMLAHRPEQRLTIAEVASIADQTLDVLVAAHEKGILHRDLKPDNLFLTSEGKIKILDFGIARISDQHGSSGKTATGTVMGTPAFMPPEQAKGLTAEICAQSDLWAVGATMFYLLTGRLVHQAETASLELLAAMTHPAQPVRSIAQEIPDALASVIDRALAYEVADRWPNARSMQHALRLAMVTLASTRPSGSESIADGRIQTPAHTSQMGSSPAALAPLAAPHTALASPPPGAGPPAPSAAPPVTRAATAVAPPAPGLRSDDVAAVRPPLAQQAPSASAQPGPATFDSFVEPPTALRTGPREAAAAGLAAAAPGQTPAPDLATHARISPGALHGSSVLTPLPLTSAPLQTTGAVPRQDAPRRAWMAVAIGAGVLVAGALGFVAVGGSGDARSVGASDPSTSGDSAGPTESAAATAGTTADPTTTPDAPVLSAEPATDAEAPAAAPPSVPTARRTGRLPSKPPPTASAKPKPAGWLDKN